MKFLRSESYKQGILMSVGWNVIAKGLSFVNSIIIAFYFGAQAKTDIYFYLYATVGLLIGFIGSLDSSVIIPEAMRIREQEDGDKAKQFLNFFLYLYAGIGVIVVLILLIDPARLLGWVSNFDTVRLQQSQGLIFWFMPICLLMLITTFLTNILSSYKFFTLPILAGIINNLFSILFLVLMHRTLDIKSLVLGLGAGYLVNISILVLLMKRQLQWNFKIRLFKFDINLKANIRYALFGNIASFFSGYAPFYIMSNFNPGVVTMFNYAKSLSEIPNQMIINQFSAVSGIRFNELASQGRREELNSLFLQSTNFLLFVLTPIVGLLFLFADKFITLLYLRGAFDVQAVKQTAFILKFLSFSVIYFAINTMVARLFMAAQKLKEPIRFQVISNALFIVVVFLASYSFGISGFIAGTLLFQFIMIACIHWVMKRYFSYIKFEKVLKGVLLNGLLNLFLVIGFSLLLHNKVNGLPLLAVCTAFYFLLVILANHIFHIDNISRQYVIQIVWKIK